MPGDYTHEELATMSGLELVAAQKRGFKKPDDEPQNLGSAAPLPPQPRENVWAGNRDSRTLEDFVVPSGQKCRLRKVTPEMLLPLGILDRITRLEGLAEALVAKAEGQPPATEEGSLNPENFKLLMETLNLLVPVAVETPTVWADDAEDAPADAIRVSHIDLMDRVAIMEHSLRGIRAMDRFRQPG
jgi:hypothetical protein